MFDHAAARAQVARCIEHAAGDEGLLQFGALTEIPATFASLLPTVTDADRDKGDNTATIVSIAREIFAGLALPRQGQHFAAADGTLYRITDTSRIQPQHPRLEFVCTVSPPA